MLDTLLELPFAFNRHRDAPLLEERLAFLKYLQERGTSRVALRNVSGQMLHVIDLLKLETLRDVELGEVKEAARRWGEEQRANVRARTYVRTESYFEYVAKKWLHFAGKLKSPLTPRIWFTDYLEDFARWMTEEQGLSSLSVRSHRWKASRFLTWFAERHAGLADVRLQDVDEFLILQGSTRWNRKNQLKDQASVADKIYELVISHSDAVTLNQFILGWGAALDRSKELFMRSIRSLDLADYANVRALILESEGEPLGDYVLDIYDLHLHSLLEGDVNLAKAAQKLTTIDWQNNYPPAQFTPSDQLNAIMDGALFHNQVRTDSYLDADAHRTPRFGEVFLAPFDLPQPTEEVLSAEDNQESVEVSSGGTVFPAPLETGAGELPEEVSEKVREKIYLDLTLAAESCAIPNASSDSPKRYAYIVLSQACDLQHCLTDRLLLLRGEATKYNWSQHDTVSKLRTPIMYLDDEVFSIDWDLASPETWPLSTMPELLKKGFRRARTFRMPFALQIQQAFIGQLGRVGTLAALPTRFAAGVKIFMKTATNTSLLLVETNVNAGEAVCLVGRDDKKKLIEWLLLSPDIKQKLRQALSDVSAETFAKGTPNLAQLRSDPAFLRALGKGLVVKRDKQSGSRPFKDNQAFDLIQILTKPKVKVGEVDNSLAALVIEIDFGNAHSHVEDDAVSIEPLQV